MADQQAAADAVLDVPSALFGAMAAMQMKQLPSLSLSLDTSAAVHGIPSIPAPPTTAQSPTHDSVVPDDAVAAAPRRGRPRMHGSGRKENLSMRESITYAHKLAVIDFYDAHERDINATVREFYAHLSAAAVGSRKRQIYKWVKERSVIEAMCFKQSTAGHSRRRDKGTATTLGVQGELELVMWIQAIKLAGPDAGVGEVSTQTIRAKALEIADKRGVPAGSFQATWSWQQGFLKRHHEAINKY